PDVADASSGFAGFPVMFGSVRADGIALAAAHGEPLLPTPLQGRLPAAADEVVLGRSTLAALHAHVGGTVRGAFPETTGEPLTMRVVGEAVFPSLSDAMGLGKGAAVTPDGLHRLIPAGLPPPDTILVRFRSGLARTQSIAALQRRLGAEGFAVVPPERPNDLVNFGRVQALPLVLGGLLAAFAVITLVHLLVTSIRRRRRDLAVLKTLGLTSGQVQATVAWQATTIAMVAVVLGVPAGLAAARWVWLLFARQLGIVPEPASPLLALGALGVATVLVANLVALLPGRLAARTSPALVLRSE
ncbi:MAG: FtsX-like permease family protein, partial [Candidatus Dormibacteraeota bacterium]|nr:FtsX-like permease family protein [Candidatus Dormibacteraeota bacterium]